MLFISFFITLILIVLFSTKKTRFVKSEDDFLSAGKKFHSKDVANVILATIIGGASTIGSAQLAYKYGIVGAIYTISAGFACYILGKFFAIPLRRSNNITITEFIGDFFGLKFQKYTSLLSSFALIIQLLAQILSAMSITLSLLNLSFYQTYLITVVIIALFVFFGGILSNNIIGKIKIVLIYTILLVSFVIIFYKTGYFTDLTKKIPSFNTYLLGNNYKKSEIIFDIITSIIGVLSTQAYLQAVFSAKDLRSARKGAYLSGLIIPVIGLLSVSIGIYMRAYYPDIKSSLSVMPQFILTTFPSWLSGAFFAGLFIIILGTCSGLILSLATNIYIDFVKDKIKWAMPEVVKIRIIILKILLFTATILFMNKNSMILNLTYISMGLRGSVILLPMILSIYFKKYTNISYLRYLLYLLPIIYLISIYLKV